MTPTPPSSPGLSHDPQAAQQLTDTVCGYRQRFDLALNAVVQAAPEILPTAYLSLAQPGPDRFVPDSATLTQVQALCDQPDGWLAAADLARDDLLHRLFTAVVPTLHVQLEALQDTLPHTLGQTLQAVTLGVTAALAQGQTLFVTPQSSGRQELLARERDERLRELLAAPPAVRDFIWNLSLIALMNEQREPARQRRLAALSPDEGARRLREETAALRDARRWACFPYRLTA